MSLTNLESLGIVVWTMQVVPTHLQRIIKTFQVMAVLGNSGDNSSFTQGISEALVTTAQGLIVAIPVLIMHGMLRAYVKAKMGEAELVSIAIINGQSELKK